MTWAEIGFSSSVFISHHLTQARALLILSVPDPGLWKGAAATTFEVQLMHVVSELERMQGEIWD